MTATPEAVQAAIAAHAHALIDRPDPMVLSDERLFQEVLDAAEPHLLAPVYKWLVEDVGYPFDFVFSDEKPGWLDLTALAEAWAAHEEDTVENYVTAILSETGWPDAGPLCDECGLIVCICAGGGQDA